MEASLRKLASSKAILQAADFARLRIHPQEIKRLVSKGELVRVGRGRYLLPQAEHSENLGLALVAAAVPKSVVCLLSALRYQGIGTQAPHEVWITVAQGEARPRVDYPSPLPTESSAIRSTAFQCGSILPRRRWPTASNFVTRLALTLRSKRFVRRLQSGVAETRFGRPQRYAA
jgi:hypothetical protein